jgi:hypothetical protein
MTDKLPIPLEASDRERADLSNITPFNEEQHKEVEQIALAAFKRGQEEILSQLSKELADDIRRGLK